MTKKVFILFFGLLSIFLWSVSNQQDPISLKKNAARRDGKSYSFQLKQGEEKLHIKLYFSDLIDSYHELKQIFQFNNKQKYFEKNKYFGLDQQTGQKNQTRFHKKFYQAVINNNFSRVDCIIEYFLSKSRARQWTREYLAAQVISFVQSIEYAQPMTIIRDKRNPAHYYDFFTPNQILLFEKGDCDSKAVLLAILLKRLNYDLIVLWSDQFQHTMIGLNIESQGAYYQYEGKKYYFVETTAQKEIGFIYLPWQDGRYWQALSL